MGELSASQVKAIQDSWQHVRNNLKTLGPEFFMDFFAKHPEYKGRFVNLKDLPDDKLATSTQLKGHGIRVLSALTSYIDNLDDKDVFTDLLEKNGRDHIPRGLTVQDYQNVFGCLLSFMEKKLGGSFDGNTKSAWEAAVPVMCSLLGNGLGQ